MTKVSLLECRAHATPHKDIALGLQVYHEHNADAVVAVGGGSGLDAGKCIAMAVASGGAVPLKNFEKGRDTQICLHFECKF